MDKIFITVAAGATLAFFIISAIVVFSAHNRRLDAAVRFRYRPRKQLMTGPEKHCFQLLNDIFGQKFYIIPQVSLDALLSHKVGHQDRNEAYSYIENKTVDFVFCNKRTLRPICAIKLDDGRKPTDNSIGSDPREMEKFFRSAHLPFVRITKPDKLDRQTIIEEFSRVIYETSILPAGTRGRKKKQ